jgi:hypothetical protein
MTIIMTCWIGFAAVVVVKEEETVEVEVDDEVVDDELTDDENVDDEVVDEEQAWRQTTVGVVVIVLVLLVVLVLVPVLVIVEVLVLVPVPVVVLVSPIIEEDHNADNRMMPMTVAALTAKARWPLLLILTLLLVIYESNAYRFMILSGSVKSSSSFSFWKTPPISIPVPSYLCITANCNSNTGYFGGRSNIGRDIQKADAMPATTE